MVRMRTTASVFSANICPGNARDAVLISLHSFVDETRDRSLLGSPFSNFVSFTLADICFATQNGVQRLLFGSAVCILVRATGIGVQE